MIPIKTCTKRPATEYSPNPRFGTVYSPHMLKMSLQADQTDGFEAEIVPYDPEPFRPSLVSLHYGQSVFEGMKTFRQKDGSVATFRADLHAKRFMESCQKMSLPVMGEEVFLQCLKAFQDFEEPNVPNEEDHALYIRPFMFGSDEVIKVGRSASYLFYILGAIAGPYFHGGIRPARVLVTRHFVRAFPGGLGEIKTAANYAASLGPQTYGEQFKCDQVLYLDAYNHDFVDELGGMNFFMVKNGELVTPALNGCILNGVTRRSIIHLAPSLGLKAREEKISFTEVLSGIKDGSVTEVFACGTAAVVHPIGEFVVQDKPGDEIREVQLPKDNPIATQVLATIKDAQRGKIDVPSNWLFK